MGMFPMDEYYRRLIKDGVIPEPVYIAAPVPGNTTYPISTVPITPVLVADALENVPDLPAEPGPIITTGSLESRHNPVPPNILFLAALAWAMYTALTEG